MSREVGEPERGEVSVRQSDLGVQTIPRRSLRVEGGRTYLGRSATGLEFETEGPDHTGFSAA
jgi:hypothetical protein